MRKNHGWNRLAPALALLFGVASPSLAAGDERVERLYEVRHLGEAAAALLARQECLAQGGIECRVEIAGHGMFELLTDGATHDKVARFLAERDVPPRTQLFQVILLAAGNAPAPAPELPPSARRALDDLETLLPFHGYQLIDSSLARSSDEALFTLGGDVYTARLRFRGGPASDDPLEIQRFQLGQRVPVPPPAGDGSGDAAAVSAGFTTREVLSSSFSMQVGETVVVGTSRRPGADGQALVVLLTAVAE